MTLRSLFACATSALALALTACSGAGSSSDIGSSVAPSSAADTTAATLSVSVPMQTASSTERSPQYISLQTQSFVILTDGANPQILNLNVSSPNCRTEYLGASLACALTIKTGKGVHNFTLTSYSQTNGKGSALSTNSTGPVTVMSGANVPVAISLNGIVASYALSLQSTAPPIGTAAKILLSVVLKDAAGAVIVGGAAFKNAVTLTSSDTVNAPLSTTLLNSPADMTNLTVNYNGANIAHATIGASASGVADTAAGDAILSPVTVAAGATKIYVATNFAGQVFTFNADGSASTPTISGFDGAIGVALDASGKIYVSESPNVETFTSSGTQTSPTYTGGMFGPQEIAVDAAGKLYVANRFGDSPVTTYKPDGTQTTPTITGFSGATDVAVDKNGKIYVVDTGVPGFVYTFNADGSPAVPTISNLTFPVGVAVDANGKIYVASNGNIITTYNPDGSQTTPTITTGLHTPNGIAVDKAGKIYVTNAGSSNNDAGSITTYNPDGTETTPTITGLEQPFGIAVR